MDKTWENDKTKLIRESGTDIKLVQDHLRQGENSYPLGIVQIIENWQ